MSLYDEISAAKNRVTKLNIQLTSAKNALSMSGKKSKIAHWSNEVTRLTGLLVAANRKVQDLEIRLEGIISKPVKCVNAAPRTIQFYPSVEVNAVELMERAAQHMKDRAKTYDKPEGERSIPKVVEMFNIATGHKLTPEQGWLFQVLLKIVRANQGEFKLDSFEDMIAYAALYGEEAFNANQQQ